MSNVTRRTFLTAAAATLATSALAKAAFPQFPENPDPVTVPPPPDRKIGVAVVGLGKLSIGQILPAFATSEHCRLVAFVSGHPDKAKALAARYNLDPKNIYNYQNFDTIKDNPNIDVVYIVLPNGLHAEYTVRAAQAGKHVLCEKPMANSSAECQQMIDACKTANKQLMIAYRLQTEPLTLAVKKMLKDQSLGRVKLITAQNCQNEKVGLWRNDKALSGFGALGDIGVYCLNTSRFILGEEPMELQAYGYSTPNDPRFKDLYETVNFSMRFPSGILLNATCSFGVAGKYYGLCGESSSALIQRAYGYHGQQLTFQEHLPNSPAALAQPTFPDIDQFATEMDAFAKAITTNTPIHCPGEEGLRDITLLEQISKSAQSNQLVKL